MKNVASMLIALVLPAAAFAGPDTAAAGAESFVAKNITKFVGLKKWHNSYLVVDSVDSSTIYAMRSDGSVTIYSPYAVDANVYGCSGGEKRRGNWCISRGKRFKYREYIAIKSGPDVSGIFHVNKAGRTCAYPDPDVGYEGKCENPGRFEATEEVKAELNKNT